MTVPAWEYMVLPQDKNRTMRSKVQELHAFGASGWEYDGDLEDDEDGLRHNRLLRRPMVVTELAPVEMMTRSMSAVRQLENRSRYDYTTDYLMKDEAANSNNVVAMMNERGEDGWHFTGYAKEVLNGTFYFFEREKD